MRHDEQGIYHTHHAAEKPEDPYHELICAVLRQALHDAAGTGILKQQDSRSSDPIREYIREDAQHFFENKDGDLSMWLDLLGLDSTLTQRMLIQDIAERRGAP